MTPKKKANELIEKYADSLPSIFYNVVEAKNYHSAKRCALIAVHEILKVVSFYNDTQAEITYWQEVKQEIEKL